MLTKGEIKGTGKRHEGGDWRVEIGRDEKTKIWLKSLLIVKQRWNQEKSGWK